jgi:hypothetical protein
MSPRRSRFRLVVFPIVLLACVALLAVAIASGLPASIDAYPNWTRLNTDRVTTNPTGAHPASKDVYVNLAVDTLLDDAGAYLLPFPDGTVLVKERNDVSRLLVDRVYTMEKSLSRWEYAFFDRQPDGGFSATLLGGDNFCHACHTRAQETDFVFTPFGRR